MAHQYIFQMQRLTKAFPPDKTVLNDVTLAFYPGAKIGVLGYNGAGKSTVLRIMAGLETDFRGEAARFHVVGGVADDALLVDDEGGAHQALVAHAFGLFFLDHAVLAAHVAFGIRKQADREAIAVAEVGVMDMLRFRAFTVGKAWESDYGSADNPDDFKALLALRITLGLFLVQWGIEKFVVPQNTVAIWSYFYGVNLPQVLSYLFGAVEIAIAVCLFFGLFRTVA